LANYRPLISAKKCPALERFFGHFLAIFWPFFVHIVKMAKMAIFGIFRIFSKNFEKIENF